MVCVLNLTATQIIVIKSSCMYVGSGNVIEEIVTDEYGKERFCPSLNYYRYCKEKCTD